MTDMSKLQKCSGKSDLVGICTILEIVQTFWTPQKPVVSYQKVNAGPQF